MGGELLHVDEDHRKRQSHLDRLRRKISVLICKAEIPVISAPMSSSKNTEAPPGCRPLNRVTSYTLASTTIHYFQNIKAGHLLWSRYNLPDHLVYYAMNHHEHSAFQYSGISCTNLCHFFKGKLLQFFGCHCVRI